MAWAVKSGWRYEAVEVVKETAKMVTYIDRYWSPPRETRIAKHSLLPWRGTEEQARAIVEKLTSAKSERDRRTKSAQDWFDKRAAEIMAASGIEARRVETERLDAKHESPTAATPNTGVTQ